MDQEILKKLEEQDKKLEAIFRSVEKTRKYFSIHWSSVSSYGFWKPLTAFRRRIF
jgi:hypothetical protein